MKFELFLIVMAFASEKQKEVESEKSEKIFGEKTAENLILVKIEEEEYAQKKASKYFGVFYDNQISKWKTSRWSRKENKTVYNGSYNDEETAAHASDTLARKLMTNGEQNHKLNFPDDETEFYPEKNTSSEFIGVTYNASNSKWRVQRRSKIAKKMIRTGYYDTEETAAHASDTLARNLMKNGEHNHKLNFPDDYTEVYKSKKPTSSKYIGVSFCKNFSTWCVRRWSKKESKNAYNGYYKDEDTAAHASDNLARDLMENGDKVHKLNFPDNNTEVYSKKYQRNKRKRSDQNSGDYQTK